MKTALDNTEFETKVLEAVAFFNTLIPQLDFTNRKSPEMKNKTDIIIKEIHQDILKISPDLLSDASDNGIMLCGGGSLIFDIADRLSKQLSIRCEYVDEPRLAKIKGLGSLINNDKWLDDNGYRFIFRDEINDRFN